MDNKRSTLKRYWSLSLSFQFERKRVGKQEFSIVLSHKTTWILWLLVLRVLFRMTSSVNWRRKKDIYHYTSLVSQRPLKAAYYKRIDRRMWNIASRYHRLLGHKHVLWWLFTKATQLRSCFCNENYCLYLNVVITKVELLESAMKQRCCSKYKRLVLIHAINIPPCICRLFSHAWWEQ